LQIQVVVVDVEALFKELPGSVGEALIDLPHENPVGLVEDLHDYQAGLVNPIIIGLETCQNNNTGITGLMIGIENKAPPRSIHGVLGVPGNESAETLLEGQCSCVAYQPVQVREHITDLHMGNVVEESPTAVALILELLFLHMSNRALFI
jgi:hypothetical protein